MINTRARSARSCLTSGNSSDAICCTFRVIVVVVLPRLLLLLLLFPDAQQTDMLGLKLRHEREQL